jgi:hypothetical protein
MAIEIQKNVYEGFTKPNENQTPIAISPGAQATTDTIYTVPTGKTFYLTGYVIDCQQGNQTLSINDGVNNYLTCLSWNAGIINFPHNFSHPILIFQEDTVLTVVSTSGATDNWIQLFGWLE